MQLFPITYCKTLMNAAVNLRILIIDHNKGVRKCLRESLESRYSEKVEQGDEVGFARNPASREQPRQFDFEVHEASNGREGAELIRLSLIEKRPYAVIFMDMRRSGEVEAVREIRSFDQNVEIVSVSTPSSNTVKTRVELGDLNIGFYCNPLSPEEIRQVAIKATHDWNHNRDLERLVHMVSELRASENHIQLLLANILHQVGKIVGDVSALIVRRSSPDDFHAELGTGQFHDANFARGILEQLRSSVKDASFPLALPDQHLLVFSLGEFHLVALHEDGLKINSDRIYLLTLLLESAGASIKNSRLQKEVAEKERLSALGHALGGIVHDLRNPIGAITSLTTLLAESLASRQLDEALELQKLILASSQEAMELLEDILDFTRSATCTPARLEVSAFFALVEQKASGILTEMPVNLRFKPLPHAIFLGDHRKLVRVFLNLIKNAAEVLFATRTAHPEIIVGAVEDQNTITFSVSDNGPGIPPELYENLFQPFVTLGKSNGTGLGLSIVRQIVEAHGATIQLMSTRGLTCFSFSLPGLDPNQGENLAQIRSV